MPANLPPQYYEVEKRLKTAKTPLEKIQIYEELYSIMPKHKGTDKLQGDIKKRISKLREELLWKKSQGKRQDLYYIKKEGAGQIVLIGPPNVGKSSILSSLTNATPKISDYPFTTTMPFPGMMQYKDIQIQLVDTPPITKEHKEGWQLDLIRRGDCVILVVDLTSDDTLYEIESIVEILQDARIRLVKNNTEFNQEPGFVYKKAIIVANKYDINKAENSEKILKDLIGSRYEILSVSAKEGNNIEVLRERLYDLLGIIRVYTKQRGKEPDLKTPFVISEGSSLLELAELIHKDFAENLKFARAWGKDKFDGQRVPRDYILQDGDIIELHM